MTLRIAIRSLLRNRWRSALTAGGIAAAVAMMIFTTHLTNSMLDEMIASFTQSELGDIQITSRDYVDESNLYNAASLAGANLAAVRAVPGVEALTARVLAFGLVGDERHSQVAKLIGVVPADERRASRVPARVVTGEWLPDVPPPPPAPREVVLGKILAKQLQAAPGSLLVVFSQGADGSLGNDRLRVRGIAETASTTLDRMGVWMHIDDAQWLTALEGRAHEIAIKTAPGADLDAIAGAVRGATASDVLAVRPWFEVVPELSQMIEMTKRSMWVMYIVIYLIAALGVLNAQRMTALERRREFGVLIAIGTTPGRLARQVIAETVLLAIAGGALGGVIGALVAWYFQTHGLSFNEMSSRGGNFTYQGVRFDVFYFHLNWADVAVPAALIVFVGLLCGLWPAASSARIDPPRAIAGRS